MSRRTDQIAWLADEGKASDIGKRIRAIRQRRGLNQPQLAAQIGVTKNAVTNWETGLSRPDLATIPKICAALHVSADLLLGLPRERLTEEEKLHLAAWRKLTSPEQASVSTLIEALFLNRQAAAKAAPALVRALRLPWAEDKVCAGSGNALSERTDTAWCYLREGTLTSKADEVINVTGDSMEPVFHDGDSLLVQFADTLQEGEVGVFVLNGEGTVKEYRRDGLYPYNRKHAVIRPAAGDSLRLIGRVLGRVTEDMIATDAEIEAARGAYSR